jgi:hypothetical protein
MKTVLLFLVWSTLGVGVAMAQDAAQRGAPEAKATEPVLTTSSIRPAAVRKPQKVRERRHVAAAGYGHARAVPTIVGIAY